MKKSTKIFLGAAGALTALNCVKAARFKPEKSEAPEPPQENVNEERAAEHLSAAIRIKTISNADKALVDWSEFEKFRAFLDEAYPLIKEKLSKEIVEEANIVYRWKGKNPSLEPIALLSHQDVVPVTPGTEDDWEHPAFEGYNDGE
ncbi:MAG: hypothetical protein K6F09_01590, partial [Clostridiales bacterium]|nr:hypothetical protein [Clostridiales bacterium]